MRVSVMSDLHLDFADLTLPGGDVLILSGDLCEAKSIKRDLYKTPEFMAAHPDMKQILVEGGRDDRRIDRYYRFLEEECSKYREVIYVFGNHEHYGSTYHKTFEHVRAQLPSNIHLLENETFELDGVLFLGATLWTDMNNMDQLTMYHMKSMMNDYRHITMLNEAKQVYHKLTPEYTVEQHIKTKQYFTHVLSENRQSANPKPVVVVTHHSPSKRSTHPRYATDIIMNGAYSSDLDEFILENPEIKFWTHGHTHEPFRYRVGDCEVICNPRGYKMYEQRAEVFDPTEGFDI